MDTDVKQLFVKILGKPNMKGTYGRDWCLPRHPELTPNNLGKGRCVCNAASEYKEVCLNDKLLAGLDLLDQLIGTILVFRDGPIALTAEIKSIFLQLLVPKQERVCLRFLWRPRADEPVPI